MQVAGGGARGGGDEAGEGELKGREVEAEVGNATLRLWVGERYLGALSVLCFSIYITDWHRPHTDSINAWAKNRGRRNGLLRVGCSLRL